MGKSAAIAPGRGLEPDSLGFLDPLLDADLVAVQADLTFNYGEFAIIKSRVEYGFPDTEEFDRVAVPQPVGDEKLSILRPQHISQGDIIAFLAR
jgi:hypothetical protein